MTDTTALPSSPPAWGPVPAALVFMEFWQLARFGVLSRELPSDEVYGSAVQAWR